jgi:hypothetical protein
MVEASHVADGRLSGGKEERMTALQKTIEAYESRMAQADGWAGFSDDDLKNMVRYLVARCEADCASEEELAILWVAGCELTRRRLSSGMGAA